MRDIDILLANEIALALVVLALGGVCVLLLRRMRALGAIVAPAGALMTTGGPQRGAILGAITARTIAGDARPLGVAGRRTMLLFVADACPISRKIIPIARAVAASENLALVFAGDEEDARQARFAERIGVPPEAFVNDPDLGRRLGIDKLPTALLLDASGALVARGLVNSREHLESLIVSGELSIPSIQSYLQSRGVANAA